MIKRILISIAVIFLLSYGGIYAIRFLGDKVPYLLSFIYGFLCTAFFLLLIRFAFFLLYEFIKGDL